MSISRNRLACCPTGLHADAVRSVFQAHVGRLPAGDRSSRDAARNAAEAQAIDVWFRPWPQAPRGWVHDKPVLAAIAQKEALLEPFHQTPVAAEILNCVGKQQTVFGELLRKNSKAVMPTMWIVSSGRPLAAIDQLGFSPIPEVAGGVYSAPSGFQLWLVVASELPRTRSTLMLRLLGAGRTFHDALKEYFPRIRGKRGRRYLC